MMWTRRGVLRAQHVRGDPGHLSLFASVHDGHRDGLWLCSVRVFNVPAMLEAVPGILSMSAL